MNTRLVTELVSSYPSHRLSRENHRGLWPVCANTDGSLTPLYGYRLIGWCRAPYAHTSEWAVVFEKVTQPDDESLTGDQREAGVWWIHGDPKVVRFTEGATAFTGS